MKRTISTMVGKGSVTHNSRTFTAENVDSNRTHLNIDYCNKPIKKVYHEMFDEALKQHNDKQKRKDRKISDYYKHIESGNVYIEIDGQQYTNIMLTAGQTFKLVAAPARGYVFDHFEKFYSLTVDGIVLDGDTYTLTEEDARENFILFKGVFKEDPNEKVFAARGSSAWLLDEAGQPTTAVGNVVFLLNDGSYSRETTAIAGETLKLNVSVTNPDDMEKYEVATYSLMNGFPTAVIPAEYEVSAADADSEGVIWICAVVREKSSGIDGVSAGSLAYDSKTMTIRCHGTVKVFNIEGRLVKEGAETEVSVAELEQGVYIAVSGSDTIKFVK